MSRNTVNERLLADTIQLNQSQSSMINNYIVIYLDISRIFATETVQNYIIELRRISSIVETFNDVDGCVDYMTDVKENRVILIINEFDVQFIVPIIHDFEQLYSIFILRTNRSNDEEWSMQYNKVKGTFSDITSIEKHLEEIQYGEHNPIGFEITSSSTSSLEIDGNKKNKQEVMFMYGQLVKEMLTELPYSTADVSHMIEFCLIRYVKKERMIEKIVQFERDYRSEAALHWYTKTNFPFEMVNTALRTHDLSTLYAMRVFIQDVHKQIVQLHANVREPLPLTLYRGQRMSSEEFERIKSNSGGLLSINSFWSTSADETVAQCFSGTFDGMIPIVFVINIDPSVRTTTFFANLEKASQFGDHEKEYLFTMGSIFRIGTIEKPDKNEIWKVNLRLTSDNDPQLTRFTASIRSAVKKDNGSHICGFATLMMYMDEHELAAQMLETIIERETDPLERMKMHWTLGILYTKLRKNHQALINYEQVVKSPALRFLSTEMISCLYHGLGELCIELKKFNLALINMEIGLHVEMLCVPHHNDEQLARYCRDIGCIYETKGDLKDALSFYQVALKKAMKCYSSHHPMIARCALDLARVYSYQGQEKYAESILKHHVPNIGDSLPPNHSFQVHFHVHAGYTRMEQGDFSGAHAHFQSALAIDLRHREESHPGNFAIYWVIATAFAREGRLNEAYDALTTALDIQIATLSPEHPDIAMTYTEIGKILESLDDFSQALFYYERAMDILRQHESPTDPDIAQTQQHINRLYKKLDRYHASQST